MNIYTEVAESIVEHAESIARLDARALSGGGFDATVAGHVHAIRVLAVSHIGDTADRAFFKALQKRALQAEGVFVHMPDGVIEFLVDARPRQLRFELLNAHQLQEATG